MAAADIRRETSKWRRDVENGTIGGGGATYPAEVAGHVRSGNEQYIDGSASYAQFDIQANITENLWESVGPTGSGATNIWAAMDDIPAEATMILAQLFLNTSPNAAGEVFIIAYGAQNGITPVFSIAATELGRFNAASTAATLTHGMSIPVKIPLDGDQVFQATWDESSGTDERVCRLYYRGFRTD